MAYTVPALGRLVEQFERLPGIGHKRAQQLALYLIAQPPERARAFAEALLAAKNSIRRCSVCQNLTEEGLCPICRDEGRDRSLICVVEDPRDVLAFERTREYKGLYHVLHGLISPIDGVGPEQLSVRELLTRLADEGVTEVIMATSPTVEGEATAMYLARLIKPMGVAVSRLAYGVPVGSALEYADDETLYRALEGRNRI